MKAIVQLRPAMHAAISAAITKFRVDTTSVSSIWSSATYGIYSPPYRPAHARGVDGRTIHLYISKNIPFRGLSLLAPARQ